MLFKEKYLLNVGERLKYQTQKYTYYNEK